MTAADPEFPPGKVFLVGGGPGDPDLLTVKAARLIAQADVLVYDNLVSPAVVAHARADAERIYVGKKAGNHTLPQIDINQLLVSLARAGRRVVRLKGGDPLIFGRGGEEADSLREAGIPFGIVPGVTAAAGAAASTGIPLTHRDHAQALVFVTGHLKDQSCSLDWPSLARPGQTLVFYMGLTSLPEISRQLIDHGMPATTPVACIRRATLPDQQTLVGTLADLPAQVAAAGIKPPALLIVGNVVKCA
ncbi:MAG: uroporphyrinogen-III C-methyltransferase [Candidatus Dactylopiibacterium carminicum]|uniref:uroporphyrinogen-III C-methyltransferase n=1 Tax=Candidatus Dactylopiibacterium carminicum TaxID=857335 RepID=A0A272ERL5_9RHOO|nr:uroporphyrinogen-III C-methyltransferase [Candidatus Dactylopiibacterium carminicum]KAF7598837.1 uroporphyrinogen-III C-methyltransferase [Candidatus Dactylopiibacterium carminicum]PAS92753.1 MAG: uroporphyrinogen-III C-methyltransferase [Candidatus Dactylopiibacterium carminicum]PAS98855.1 MAG: uroporphyrinogen-III C-methyltransferase [Candidatus Dactylopiibacterium carminicum]